MLDLTHLKNWAWEREYLSEIFRLIPEVKAVALHWRSERLFPRRLAYFRPKFAREKLVVPDRTEDTVLIIISDELYRIPPGLGALAVFKQYVSAEDQRSIPFPLGFRCGFPALPITPMAKRTVDVGFKGRMYPHRRAFLGELSRHPRLKHFRIDLNPEARLSIAEYADFLNNSRISLCLGGNASPETFRFYESIKMGCIVVSPKMPANGLYESHPGLELDQIDDVDAVAEVVESALANSQKHVAWQERSLQTWEMHYSPPAMAKMIDRVVKSQSSGRSSSRGGHVR